MTHEEYCTCDQCIAAIGEGLEEVTDDCVMCGKKLDKDRDNSNSCKKCE